MMCTADLHEVIHELRDQVAIEQSVNRQLGEALQRVNHAAKDLCEKARCLPEDIWEQIGNEVENLEDSIPCDDCLCAPCRCPG